MSFIPHFQEFQECFLSYANPPPILLIFFFSCSKPFQPFKKFNLLKSQLPRWSHTSSSHKSLKILGKTQFGTTLHSTNVHYYYLHLIGPRVQILVGIEMVSRGWGQLHLIGFYGVCFIFVLIRLVGVEMVSHGIMAQLCLVCLFVHLHSLVHFDQIVFFIRA